MGKKKKKSIDLVISRMQKTEKRAPIKNLTTPVSVSMVLLYLNLR